MDPVPGAGACHHPNILVSHTCFTIRLGRKSISNMVVMSLTLACIIAQKISSRLGAVDASYQIKNASPPIKKPPLPQSRRQGLRKRHITNQSYTLRGIAGKAMLQCQKSDFPDGKSIIKMFHQCLIFLWELLRKIFF